MLYRQFLFLLFHLVILFRSCTAIPFFSADSVTGPPAQRNWLPQPRGRPVHPSFDQTSFWHSVQDARQLLRELSPEGRLRRFVCVDRSIGGAGLAELEDFVMQNAEGTYAPAHPATAYEPRSHLLSQFVRTWPRPWARVSSLPVPTAGAWEQIDRDVDIMATLETVGLDPWNVLDRIRHSTQPVEVPSAVTGPWKRIAVYPCAQFGGEICFRYASLRGSVTYGSTSENIAYMSFGEATTDNSTLLLDLDPDMDEIPVGVLNSFSNASTIATN